MRRPLCFACLLLTLCMAVFCRLHPPETISYGEAAGREVCLTGRVYAKEYKGGDSPVLSLYIEPSVLSFQEEEIPFQDSFICMLQEETDVPIGSTVAVCGVLREYEPASNPGQFDAEIYYTIQHISAKIQKAELLFSDGKTDVLREGLWKVKRALACGMEAVFAKDDAAILKTMLLGDKSSLTDEVKTLYKEAGILHILAISGLHITLLGMGFFKILRRLRMPILPASLLCGGCMLLYGMLTGMPVSAVRAIGMFLLRLLAGCIGRTYDMLTALSVCGAAMLISQPYYLYHSGFLLSYLAVLAIPLLKPAILPDSLKQNPLAETFFSTLAISLFTFPVQLFFFCEVSVYAAFLNLAVVPLVGVVMILGILGLVSYFLLPALAPFFAAPAHEILNAYSGGASFFRDLPGSMWTPGKPEAWQIAVYCLLLAVLLVCKKLKWKYRIGLLCGAVMVFCIHDRSMLRITFLDVGQGDCICVELPEGGVWLFDGGSTGVSDVGTYRIAPFLKSCGITELDGIFLSHDDADHINGVEELLREESIQTGLLALPCTAKGEAEMFEGILEAAAAREIPVLWLEEGMTWESNGVKAVCLHPDGDFFTENANAASMVVYLTYGEFSMLLTGDVEEEGEAALLAALKERQMENVTVLKVAHHGSKNSTGEELLSQLNPKIAVISCGAGNRYGHPHEETLERLEAAGVAVLRTDETGAVEIEVAGNHVKVSGYMK